MRPRNGSKGARGHLNRSEGTRKSSGNSCRNQDIDRADRGGDLSLPVAAMEYVWLYDHRRGVSLRKLADRDGVSVDRVRDGVERAKALEIQCSGDEMSEKSGRRDEPEFELIPLFPIGSFTPQSTCSHRDPIEKGSRFCCMVCHTSGMDDHPALRRVPKTKASFVPAPESPKEAAAPTAASDPSPAETRKQRRRRRFAAVAVA